jgi:hypothetical protein
MICISGKNSRAAERYALSLAKRIGAGITLFHCLWDSINAVIVNTAYAGMAAFDLEMVIDRSRDDAIEAMKRKVSFFQKQGVTCGYKVEEKALTSLCAVYQECESGYSFVVMGTHGTINCIALNGKGKSDPIAAPLQYVDEVPPLDGRVGGIDYHYHHEEVGEYG